VSSTISYTGGNGGTYAAQSISSTVVTGLTATLAAGTLAGGNGTLIYNITGTPESSGMASFGLSIGGQSCNLSVTVNPAPIPLVIGAYYGGGVIGYIYKPGDQGYVGGETHGIIVALTDQRTQSTWGCMGKFIGGTSLQIGTGFTNTNAIVAGCNAPSNAALFCYNLGLNGYDDWYLPSADELLQCYKNRAQINATAVANGGTGFSLAYYWSSSELSSNSAASYNFSSNSPYSGRNKDSPSYLRAVRAF
jgi:hypothetical protein